MISRDIVCQCGIFCHFFWRSDVNELKNTTAKFKHKSIAYVSNSNTFKADSAY